MIRLLGLIVFFASLVAFAGERKLVNLETISEPVMSSMGNLRSRTVATRGSTSPRNTEVTIGNKFTQAPGLVQIDTFGDIYNNGMSAWFLATTVLPKRTLLFPYIIVEEADGTLAATRFEGRELTETIPAGYSFFLPSFHRFSSFWPAGKILTYGVRVVSDKDEESFTIDQFPVKGGWTAEGLKTLSPYIKEARINWIDGKPVLTLAGAFREPAPVIALDDYVVPPEAVVRADGKFIVDLSMVGINLTYTQVFLVTIGQEGFANSTVFRYFPQ